MASTGPTGEPSTTPSSRRFINEDTPEVPSSSTDKQEFIDEQFEIYRDSGHTDNTLWHDFKRAFARWNEADFKGTIVNKRGQLRTYLRDHGVYIDETIALARAYNDVLDQEQPPVWPTAELEAQIATNSKFDSMKKNPAKTRNSSSMGSQTPKNMRRNSQDQERQGGNEVGSLAQNRIQDLQQSLQQNDNLSPEKRASPSSSLEMLATGANSTPLRDRNREQLGQNDDHTRPRNVGPEITLPPSRSGNNLFPPLKFRNNSADVASTDVLRAVQAIRKSYRKDDCYEGSIDILDDKLRVFAESCEIYGIQEEHQWRAFSAMLVGDAKDHYFEAIHGKGYTVPYVVELLRVEFENEARRERMQFEYESKELVKLPEMSLLESFEVMRKRLIKLQRVMRPALRTDEALRDRIYMACLKVPECEIAIADRKPSFQEASEKLRNSIEIKSRQTTLQTFLQAGVGAYQQHQFYTDRGLKGRRVRFDQSSQRSHQSIAPRAQTSVLRIQKCWICHKVGHFSTMHTEEEQRAHREDFQRKKNFNAAQTQQFITLVEGIDPVATQEYEAIIDRVDLETGDDDITEIEQDVAEIFSVEAYDGDVDPHELFLQLQ